MIKNIIICLQLRNLRRLAAVALPTLGVLIGARAGFSPRRSGSRRTAFGETLGKALAREATVVGAQLERAAPLHLSAGSWIVAVHAGCSDRRARRVFSQKNEPFPKGGHADPLG